MNAICIWNSLTPPPRGYEVWLDVFCAECGVPVMEREPSFTETFFARLKRERKLRPQHAHLVCSYRQSVIPQDYTPLVRTRYGVTPLEAHDVVVVPVAWYWVKYITYLSSNFPHVTIVGIQDDSLEEASKMEVRLQREYLDAIECLDLFICLNCNMFTWLGASERSMLVSHPVKPQYLATKGKRISKAKSVCVGVGTWNIDFHNWISNAILFDQVRGEQPSLTGVLVGVFPHEDHRVECLCRDYGIQLESFEELGFIEVLRRYSLILNLTQRITCGRVSLDAALAGTPIISCRHCDLHSMLWPELSVEAHDIPSSRRLALRLLRDAEFKDECLAFADRRVQGLSSDYDKLKRTIRDKVEECSR